MQLHPVWCWAQKWAQLAIVATERGDKISVPSATLTNTSDEMIQALSWKQVDEIASDFQELSLYERDAIPGSILKVEKDNYDPKTKKQRQLWCVAISAKRYALFLHDPSGKPTLLRKGTNNEEDRWSEHGLGHLLDPTDPEDEDRDWIADVWQLIVSRALDMPAADLQFESVPAVGRITVSSPAVMRPLTSYNMGKAYSEQLKPFNFLLTAHVRAFGHPPGTNSEKFHLIALHEKDPKQWLKQNWIDQYTGKEYRISTAGPHGRRHMARVKTHGDALEEHEFHPESKCADVNGEPCEQQTIGLLQRRHVRIDTITPIGKESNNLEGVKAGVVSPDEDVYTVYPD